MIPDHAEHCSRSVERYPAQHSCDIARDEPLDDSRKKEPDEENCAQVAHRDERGLRPGEPRSGHVGSGRGLQEVEDTVDRRGQRLEHPPGDAGGDLIPTPTGDHAGTTGDDGPRIGDHRPLQSTKPVSRRSSSAWVIGSLSTL
ncbi:MAG: hypothetical protein M5T61_18735 [Acidimicrobiia bacterium]|nr:hypothetical protein [Acidimicrobiia bacterium]